MSKRASLGMILVLVMLSSAYGQRRGAIDTGGIFSFQTLSSQDSSFSRLDVDWIFGFYFSKDLIFELQPAVQFDFRQRDVFISTSLLGSFAFRIIDMEPDEYRRRRERRYDRTTAGIFLSGGGGLWLYGLSTPDAGGNTSVGPAITLGIGTHSALGKLTLLRTRFQYIYLMPSGAVYDTPRTIFKIGVGLSVFIKL